MELSESKALINTLLDGLPFAGEPDRVRAAALLLLPFARESFAGPSPLHLLESRDDGGEGRTLAAVLQILVGEGKLGGGTLPSHDQETFRLISALLKRNARVVFFAGYGGRGPIESASLATALSSERWIARVRDRPRFLDLPIRQAWVLTSSRAKVVGALARRTISIRFELRETSGKKSGRPSEANLIRWTEENQVGLREAIDLLIRAWEAAGCPAGSDRLPTYEGWSKTLGGILELAGLADPGGGALGPEALVSTSAQT